MAAPGRPRLGGGFHLPDLVELRPDSYQWGPLIFAHNTPALQGFWARKWRRVCEKMQFGARWITGCGNHDTLRRGTQVDPSEPINPHLGADLPAVLANAYDNPAIAALTYGFAPGLPMDFIHCLMRAPWGFFRNTDDRYGVKVVAEEAPGFLDWQLTPELYGDPALFPRLKRLGFTELEPLRRFLAELVEAIAATDYDLERMAERCCGAASAPPCSSGIDVAWLKGFARRFMEDMHETCNVWRHAGRVSAERAQFSLALRRFRQARPWLAGNLCPDERLDLLATPCTTIFYGLRWAPPGEGKGWPWWPTWAASPWPCASRNSSRSTRGAGRCGSPPRAGAAASGPGGPESHRAARQPGPAAGASAPLLEFDQPREVEGGLVEAAAHRLEAAGHRRLHDPLLPQGVGAGGLARAGEQLADALQQRQQRGVGREAHDQPPLRRLARWRTISSAAACG